MAPYRPKGRNVGTAMLAVPGGGFELLAMARESIEICNWMVQQGMACAVLMPGAAEMPVPAWQATAPQGCF